ncbi:hypothetical protein CERSUDRAFT_117993 [Gelatoporia subvermispora B]|uniref:MINDY deubiquitinase domain-containing protein n=1 Tax=Ceriporiopsis subvermispora (strain B) TaxID=914234 RepID=M2QMJ5_CERS8|nr:hypothetical protein CERSUDRAFT_117993 [Gelatoporia subvermispora B]
MAETTPEHEHSVETSMHEVWYLKEISFQPEPEAPTRRVKIVTQNFNGPCSFIAICNILILRGHIQILPYERTTVSYDMLSQLLGDYLLTACPGFDISAALSVMPVTRKGMDLNPLFTSMDAFRPAGTGGELKLFEQTGIQLVHGWLVDPDSPEHRALSKTQDYDTSVNLLAEADHLTKGHLMQDEAGSVAQLEYPGESSPTLTAEERQKVEDALLIRNFIQSTQSQLTYHGLFTLASTLAPGALVALFRNSHLSVLYKSRGEDAALYSLATDQVFLHEPSVVWERLEDVDGSSSAFVDSTFVRASPAGGDYAGHTGESALAALEDLALADDPDRQLAHQLQAEEDELARQVHAQRQRERAQQAEAEAARAQVQAQPADVRKAKKKSDCIVM